jgi:hypothetical protein
MTEDPGLSSTGVLAGAPGFWADGNDAGFSANSAPDRRAGVPGLPAGGDDAGFSADRAPDGLGRKWVDSGRRRA